MRYVHFLELSNGDIDIGSTNDLRRRFVSHRQGHVISTRQYLLLVVRSYVAVADEATARRPESVEVHLGFMTAAASISRAALCEISVGASSTGDG